MSYKTSYIDELNDVKTRFPKFKIVKKSDSSLMKAVAIFLSIITLGKMTKESFMQGFKTTIGYTMYVPDNWDLLTLASKHVILHHEAKHIEQMERDGAIKYALKYLFWPFPIFWAHGRLEYETEAYAAGMALGRLVYGFGIQGESYNKVIKNLTGAAYFWTSIDPDKVQRRLDFFLIKELIRNS